MEQEFKKVAWEIVHKFRRTRDYEKAEYCEFDFPNRAKATLYDDAKAGALYLRVSFEDGMSIKIAEKSLEICTPWKSYHVDPLTRLMDVANTKWLNPPQKEITIDGHKYVLKGE